MDPSNKTWRTREKADPLSLLCSTIYSSALLWTTSEPLIVLYLGGGITKGGAYSLAMNILWQFSLHPKTASRTHLLLAHVTVTREREGERGDDGSKIIMNLFSLDGVAAAAVLLLHARAASTPPFRPIISVGKEPVGHHQCMTNHVTHFISCTHHLQQWGVHHLLLSIRRKIA